MNTIGDSGATAGRTSPSGSPARRFAPTSRRNISASATSSARASPAFSFRGGVFSWLVLMPAIRFLRLAVAQRSRSIRALIPIPQMTSDQLWPSYIRPMGAGAVAAAGVITLIENDADDLVAR